MEIHLSPNLHPIDVESLICKWFGHIWSGPSAAAVIQPFHNLYSLSLALSLRSVGPHKLVRKVFLSYFRIDDDQ